MSNILEKAQRLDKESHRMRHMRAIVVSNDTNQVFIQRNGYTDPDGQSYAKLFGVTVVADDEVAMVDITGNGGWIILGKILRNT